MKRLVLFSPTVILVIVACAAPDASERVDPGIAVSGPPFRPVAQVLVDRCGSLDCHGSKYRNMRLHGFGSARLGGVLPDGPETTQAEADADFDAVVSLEPDVFRQVITERGSDPERLTFLRKARGRENHKGGAPVIAGDKADLCILSWLGGTVDEDGCKSAVPRLVQP